MGETSTIQPTCEASASSTGGSVVTSGRSPRSVVSGGAGFIGPHLWARLLERGHEVVAIDNLVTGSVANVAPLRANPAFTLVEHDVSQPIQVEEPLDYVLHFASPASPVDFPPMPIP